MSSNYTVQIDENECIGDSLDKINNNFANLDTQMSGLSTLNNTIVSFVCERNGLGTQGQLMAFGDSSTTGGLVMPLSGRIIAATLRVNSLTNGTITVAPRITELTDTEPGTTYTDADRSMTFSTVATDSTNIVKNYPITRQIGFNQGARISWVQQAVSGSVSSYQVTFYVYFTP
jgi:hypothetical protein